MENTAEYPALRLWAPVTYDADARQLICLPTLLAQFTDRYVRPAMFSLAGHPAVHCSVTRTRSRVALPGISLPPQRVIYVPRPDSRSIRLVAVAVQVACWTRWYSPRPVAFLPRYPAVSGALVALALGDVDPTAPANT